MANLLKLGSAIAIVPICTLLVFAFRPTTEPAPQADEDYETHLYITWDRFEVDRCVAAWLIKRFVDPEAEFRLLPVGSPTATGGGDAFEPAGAFDDDAAGFRRIYETGAFRSSFGVGRLSLAVSDTFTYAGVEGAAVAVYNDDGTLYA